MEHAASVAAKSATGAVRTRARFTVLALISVGTMINYLDRAVLGVAAPSMTKELGLDAVVMGIVFSAFSWTYAAAQIPGGAFLDRVGTRLAYFWSVAVWSVFTLLQGFASGLASLLTFRLGLGIAEAPCFPANSRVLSTWFPQHERARATGVYSVGQYFGLAFLSPLLFLIVADAGLARAVHHRRRRRHRSSRVIWLRFYREPQDSRDASTRRSSTTSRPAAASAIAARRRRFLAQHRQAAAAPADPRRVDRPVRRQLDAGVLPDLVPDLSRHRAPDGLAEGRLLRRAALHRRLGRRADRRLVSDMLIKRTGSATLGRKLPILAGLLLASTIVIANFVDSNELVIAIMSVAFFGQGMVNLGWTLITDVAPKHLIGLTGGVFNFCANLAGIVTPLVIGFIVGATGSFFGALAYIAVDRPHRRALVHLHRGRGEARGNRGHLMLARVSREARGAPRAVRPRQED